MSQHGKAESIALRVLNDKTKKSYQPANYDYLVRKAKSKKLVGHIQTGRMQQIRADADISRMRQMMGLHKKHWFLENDRLMDVQKLHEEELELLLQGMPGLMEYCTEQNGKLEQAGSIIQDDITRLRWASKQRLPPKSILQDIASLRELHNKMLQDLALSEKKLVERLHEHEAEDCILESSRKYLDHQRDKWLQKIQDCNAHLTDIMFECPDQEIVLQMMNELNNINTSYETRISKLNQSFQTVITLGPTAGWGPERHFVYLYLERQYRDPSFQKLVNLVLKQVSYIPMNICYFTAATSYIKKTASGQNTQDNTTSDQKRNCQA
eukprot:m.132526 g.132526  ORF g.132526 m.132526 type:complete len:324 (+) comp14648_c1_seq2:105-1076(+)